jgi:hypothetical protein
MPLGSFCDSVPEPSVFEGFKGMLPENIVQDMQALKPGVFKTLKILSKFFIFRRCIRCKAPS